MLFNILHHLNGLLYDNYIDWILNYANLRPNTDKLIQNINRCTDAGDMAI